MSKSFYLNVFILFQIVLLIYSIEANTIDKDIKVKRENDVEILEEEFSKFYNNYKDRLKTKLIQVKEKAKTGIKWLVDKLFEESENKSIEDVKSNQTENVLSKDIKNLLTSSVLLDNKLIAKEENLITRLNETVHSLLDRKKRLAIDTDKMKNETIKKFLNKNSILFRSILQNNPMIIANNPLKIIEDSNLDKTLEQISKLETQSVPTTTETNESMSTVVDYHDSNSETESVEVSDVEDEVSIKPKGFLFKDIDSSENETRKHGHSLLNETEAENMNILNSISNNGTKGEEIHSDEHDEIQNESSETTQHLSESVTTIDAELPTISTSVEINVESTTVSSVTVDVITASTTLNLSSMDFPPPITNLVELKQAEQTTLGSITEFLTTPPPIISYTTTLESSIQPTITELVTESTTTELITESTTAELINELTSTELITEQTITTTSTTLSTTMTESTLNVLITEPITTSTDSSITKLLTTIESATSTDPIIIETTTESATNTYERATSTTEQTTTSTIELTTITTGLPTTIMITASNTGTTLVETSIETITSSPIILTESSNISLVVETTFDSTTSTSLEPEAESVTLVSKIETYTTITAPISESTTTTSTSQATELIAESTTITTTTITTTKTLPESTTDSTSPSTYIFSSTAMLTTEKISVENTLAQSNATTSNPIVKSNITSGLENDIKFEVLNYTIVNASAINDSKSYSLRLHIKGYKWNEKFNNVTSSEAQDFMKKKILPLLYKHLNVSHDELNEVKLLRLFKGNGNGNKSRKV